MKKNMNKYPLRKIVGHERILLAPASKSTHGSDIYGIREKLECGHLVSVKQDIYGDTNAYRRRCKQCGVRDT